jgi:uncharacterized cupredoxin-like copper-binding protein
MASCTGDDGPRRVVQITQTDDGCTPGRFAAAPGERLTLEVTNDGKKDREIEGIEGTKLEELLVPSGRTRHVDWTAPGKAGVQKVKCYIPGGNTVIIEVDVSEPKATVQVDLVEYTVSADKVSVPTGVIRFAAHNTSTAQIHELAVLRVKDDGSFDNLGEIENLAPGKSGETVLDVAPGRYLLACLIATGEAGSTVDHFQQGMKLEFEVR